MLGIAHHPKFIMSAHPAAAKHWPIIAAHRLIGDRGHAMAVFTEVPDASPLLIVGAHLIVLAACVLFEIGAA
jgi:hypothetical protein